MKSAPPCLLSGLRRLVTQEEKEDADSAELKGDQERVARRCGPSSVGTAVARMTAPRVPVSAPADKKQKGLNRARTQASAVGRQRKKKVVQPSSQKDSDALEFKRK